jgi:hypothetical protein
MNRIRFRRWPLISIATTCVAIIIARLIWPWLNFDSTSLVLLGIVFVALVLPYVPVRKLKWGDFEAELEAVVDDLERKISATEATPSIPRVPSDAEMRGPKPGGEAEPTWQQFFDEYIKIVNSTASNVEKILAAAILVERMGGVAALAFGLAGRTARGPRAVVDQLAQPQTDHY